MWAIYTVLFFAKLILTVLVVCGMIIGAFYGVTFLYYKCGIKKTIDKIDDMD